MRSLLLVPLLALSVGTPADAQTPTETPTCVEVGDIKHRWSPDPDGPEEYVKVSFQIEVTNTCDGSEDAYVRVEMLDSDGFLVESTWTIATVRPGPDTVRFNGSFIHPSVPDQVARFDVTVEPWEF